MIYVCYQLVLKQSTRAQCNWETIRVVQSCLIDAITSPLCRINRRHRMSLMTQRGRSGTRGLSDYLWFYLYLHLWITYDYLWLFKVVNEPTCDSEVYLYLCVVDISIWTDCDAYCELSVMDVMFIWMWYVAVTEPNKLVICDSFAECHGKYTRQSGHVAKICIFWD